MPKGAVVADYDRGYKRLFSHPEMLAERVTDWTRQWKQEGLEEGLQKGRQEGQEDALKQARKVLLRDLARRFGPLPEEVRQRIDAIGSIQELTEFILRAGAASSLAALTADPR